MDVFSPAGHESMEGTEEDVWIQIHNLPLYLLIEECARKIMSRIGEVSDFDPRILLGDYGNYIRIRVRLQGTKPLRRGGYIRVLGERIWLDYVYEGIPWICGWCGCFGYKSETCEEEKIGRETNSVEGYGSWMLYRTKWGSSKDSLANDNGEQKKLELEAPPVPILDVRPELEPTLGQTPTSIRKQMVVCPVPFAGDLSAIPLDKSKAKGKVIALDSSMAMAHPKGLSSSLYISANTKGVQGKSKMRMEKASYLLLQCKQSTRRWEFKGWDPGQPRFEEERGWFGLLKWELWLLHNATFFDGSFSREGAFSRDAQTLSHWAFKVWDPGRQKAEEVRGFSGLFMWVMWLLRKATFFDGRPKRRDVSAEFDRIRWAVCGTRKLGLEDDTKPLLEDVQREKMGVGPEDIPVGWVSLRECVDLVINYEDTIVNWIHEEVFSAAHQVARNVRGFDFWDQWFGRFLSWLDDRFLNDVMVPF